MKKESKSAPKEFPPDKYHQKPKKDGKVVNTVKGKKPTKNK